MEFLCESEQQAQSFAASLTQPRRVQRERESRRTDERPSGWFKRWMKAG